MKRSFYFLLFVLFFSCQKNNINSFAMIGRSRLEIDHQLKNYKSYLNVNKMVHTVFETKDTLLYKVEHSSGPLDLLILMKNDTSIYQEINVYCSPCADQMIEKILKDKNYKFEARYPSNYLSKTRPNILLRHGKGKDSLCSNIKLYKLNRPSI
jgi:hypothetical protein